MVVHNVETSSKTICMAKYHHLEGLTLQISSKTKNLVRQHFTSENRVRVKV